ncbi:kinase-like protein [Schizopora paradoxa]|uniref:Kinase-like protein n=1 Tax=Schizopora paradoxa TaxID=27342 RepID=A0A0H2S046_9AGAM|nr:kinase-like protein [Schizopora paradoxa]
MARYRGWVSEVLTPLEDFIDHHVDPRELYADLQEIAEGDSGSVFSAHVVGSVNSGSKDIKRENGSKVVAIKSIPLVPGGSQKLIDLKEEFSLMSRIRHENILSMDGMYVDLSEDCLWIKMELMERSLADMLQLSEEGFMLPEGVIAQFTKDTLHALAYLASIGIAHRDVRSDNLLVNPAGVIKLADFSHAVQWTSKSGAMKQGAVGVVYWQAPEMRHGPYDASKVDVWSLGATCWEMAETDPPFMDEDPRRVPDVWPPLSQPEKYSQSFHEFLSLCSSQPSVRPSANDLLTTSFIQGGCGRPFVQKVLADCKDIEDRIHRRQSVDSQGTIS